MARATVTPDFGPMKVTERATWFYQQLCDQPGEIVRRAHSKGGPMQTWRKLQTSNLIELMERIGPGLTANQYRLINEYLSGLHEGARRRDSVSKGGAGNYEHYVLMPDDALDAAEPAPVSSQDEPPAPPVPDSKPQPDSDPRPEPPVQPSLPSSDNEGTKKETLDEDDLAERSIALIERLRKEVGEWRQAATEERERAAELQQEVEMLRARLERRSAAMGELQRVVKQHS